MKKATLSLLLALLLMIGMIPAGIVPAMAAGGDYTDPEHPYIATDFDGLQKVFNQNVRDGRTVYIKLGSDIKFSGKYGELRTDGANVELDLAGYTLSVKTEDGVLITGDYGSVTISDSERFDEDLGDWVTGRVEYEWADFTDDIGSFYVFYFRAVLGGDIVVKGGTFVNKNRKSCDACYAGRSLRLYGGTLESLIPIFMIPGAYRLDIRGGTLNIQDQVGILANMPDSKDEYPYLSRCEMVNASEHDRVVGFKGFMPNGYAASHTGQEALGDFGSIFYEKTRSYIDGVLQPDVMSGIMNSVDADDEYAVIGPVFSKKYVLTPVETVSNINLTVPETQVGGAIPYSASVSTPGCTVTKNANAADWKNGVMWAVGNTSLDPAAPGVFSAGKYYTANILVGFNKDTGYRFDQKENLTAYVNHKASNVIRVSDTQVIVQYVVDYTEADTVASIAITVPEPVIGGHPAYLATIPYGKLYDFEDYNADYWQHGVIWQETGGSVVTDGDFFKAEKSYTVSISLILKDPANTHFAPADEINATVNGNTAKVRRYTDSNYIVSYTFTLEKTVINTINVSVPEPVADERIPYTATIPYGKGYDIEDFTLGGWKNGIAWSDGEGNTLDVGGYYEAGCDYTVNVSMVLSDSEKYRFAPLDEITATVNGNPAKVRRYAEDNYCVYYTFSLPALDTCSVFIYLRPDADEPAAGTDVIRGEYFAEPDAPGRDDAEFIGWFTDRELQHPYDPTVPVTEDLSLFAGWKERTILLGDADNDGKVTILDATCIQRRLADLPTTSYNATAADADADGKVSIIDATYIQRWLASLPSNPAIGQPVK